MGDLSRAIPLWRRAYHQDDQLRELITAAVGSSSYPLGCSSSSFSPRALNCWRSTISTENSIADAQAIVVGRLFLDQLAGNAVHGRGSELWRKGYSVAAELRDPRAAAIGRRAVQLDPDDYTMRRRLAFELLDHQEWSAAIRQLSWCLDKNRDDSGVAAKLSWAREQSHADSAVKPVRYDQRVVPSGLQGRNLNKRRGSLIDLSDGTIKKFAEATVRLVSHLSEYR